MNTFAIETINDVFQITTAETRTVMLWQDNNNGWQNLTSADLYRLVRALATIFSAWGVKRGDRVAILSENRWEWAVTDFATLALGGVDVPIYATSTAEQIGYTLRDSSAKVVVVSNEKQFRKVQAAGPLPELERIIVMDEGKLDGTESFALLVSSASAQGRDSAFDEALESVKPEDLATLIYTSGTTGEPKGVMLSHGNLASNIMGVPGICTGDDDCCISFLPLSHITSRHIDYSLMCCGAKIAYCPDFGLLPVVTQETRPTIFVGVPRVYEKIRQAIEVAVVQSPAAERQFAAAMRVGRIHRDQIAKGEVPVGTAWEEANEHFFSRVRQAFGGRVRKFISGGAPLGMDTASWFLNAGIRIFEGYGLTETSPVIAVNSPAEYRIDTVGKPLGNLECRLADDGEIEVRGPSVFQGYWKKEQETAEALTIDGWFRTGDIGALTDGFLRITDRKKELLKTSGGKFIAPQPIENKFKAYPLIAQAALVGDKHKFASALFSPNFLALEQWATAHGIEAGDHTMLIANEDVIFEFKRIVEEVNATLASYETIKRFHLVAEEWTVESGELTPSMKLKRRVVEKQYQIEIENFYLDEATSTRHSA